MSILGALDLRFSNPIRDRCQQLGRYLRNRPKRLRDCQSGSHVNPHPSHVRRQTSKRGAPARCSVDCLRRVLDIGTAYAALAFESGASSAVVWPAAEVPSGAGPEAFPSASTSRSGVMTASKKAKAISS